MDSLKSLLRERTLRNAERSGIENVQSLDNETRKRELNALRDERLKCTETIVNNLNTIAGHKHTISKVLHQSEECIGLPISNTHHRQAREFVSDAIKFIEDQENMYKNLNSKNSIDPINLSSDVQSCTQSSADSFKAIKSSVDRVDTLMHNIQPIIDEFTHKDPDLETSIFDE